MATDTEIRAAEARQLQNNPIFQEVFENVRNLIIEQLEQVPVVAMEDHTVLRNQLGITLQCLAAVKADIQANIDTVILDAEQDKDSV